jgi:hypothetical protein
VFFFFFLSSGLGFVFCLRVASVFLKVNKEFLEQVRGKLHAIDGRLFMNGVAINYTCYCRGAFNKSQFWSFRNGGNV